MTSDKKGNIEDFPGLRQPYILNPKPLNTLKSKDLGCEADLHSRVCEFQGFWSRVNGFRIWGY